MSITLAPPKKFCRLLKKAMKDEEEAPEMYENLLNAWPPKRYTSLREEFDKNVRAIQQDEETHWRTLEEVYQRFCRH